MRLIQQGPRDAKIVIVGEAPGATEQRTGVPFSGASGELLDRMLSRVGISRQACFVTNICHVQPPGNDFQKFLKPKPTLDLIQGLVRLRDDLNEIKPNLVIALGAVPLQFLTGKVGISKWRGSILQSTLVEGLKVIATYHPAAILREWDYKAVAEFDLARCAIDSTFAELRYTERQLYLDPPREEAERLAAELRNAEWLAEDIECFEAGGRWRLACVGFSDRADRALVLPADADWKINLIRELSECDVKKVFQNGMFDVTVLKESGINVKNFAWDTMLAHHACYPECASSEDEMAKLSGKKKKQAAIQKGLAFLVSIHTRQPFYKDDGKLWKESNDIQMFWRYNALDAACTREIKDRQDEDIEALGVMPAVLHNHSLIQPLMACTERGIKIDLSVRDALYAQYKLEIERMEVALTAAAGGSVNVKSPKQMQELLYGRLGFKPQISRKTSRVTTDKDAIAALAGKYHHPVLAFIIGIRQNRDFIERYLEARVDADGRMRCSFDITGTRTGRLSSRASIYGSGTNLQNIPARKPAGEAIRRMFIADEGKIFVYRDYSQAEARIVAYLSGARGLIELFEDPTRDIHRENAARIFGKPIGDVTEEERYLAKRVVHASNYGMEADRLVQVVNEDAAETGIRIDRRIASDLITKYFMLYPEIREVFWKEVENELRYSRTLVSPFGMRRTFYGRWDDKILREAYAQIPQSTVGWLGAKALARCYYEIEPEFDGAQVLLNVHDSVMMQCWVRDVEAVAQRMEEVMAIPITVKGQTFTIPTDCKVGFNWGARPKKNPELNPNGLVDINKWLKERAA